MISLIDKKYIVIAKYWDRPVDILFLRDIIIVNIPVKYRDRVGYDDSKRLNIDWRILDDKVYVPMDWHWHMPSETCIV